MTTPTDFREIVRTNREKIAALQKLPLTEARCREICDLYEPLIEPAAETLTELDVLLDYSKFLAKQQQYDRGLSVAERLQQCYDSPAVQISNSKRSMLLNLFGLFFFKSDPARAQDCFRRGIALCPEQDGETPEAKLARWKCSYNLERLLSSGNGTATESEALLRIALSLARQLSEISEQEYADLLPISCISMASHLINSRKKDEAEPLLREALAISRRLVSDTSDSRYLLANSCINFAVFLHSTGKPEEAEPYLQEACSLAQRLAEELPTLYEELLAKCSCVFAYHLQNSHRPRQAEQLLLQAMEIYRKTPDQYVSEIATGYHNLAYACSLQQKKTEAKAYFDEAMARRRPMYDRNPRENAVPLARLCGDYANFQRENNRISSAEKLLEESIQFCRTAAAEGVDDAELTLGNCLLNRGSLALQLMQKTKAEAYYRESLSILEKYPQAKDNVAQLQNVLNEYFRKSPARKFWERLTGKNRT